MQEEFFLQGDREQSYNLPSSYLMNRNLSPEQVANAQSGFLDIFCTPLYESWCKYAPHFSFLLETLEINKNMWKSMQNPSETIKEEAEGDQDS